MSKRGPGAAGARGPARVAVEPEIPFDLPRVTAGQRERAGRLLAALERAYPNARCELNYTKPHELLAATILSAQATDSGVNKATPALFARFPAPADYAAAAPGDIEPYIRTIGLFRNKAKAVHAAMREITEKFGGEVPRTMDELLTLRGVARKTANVVLGNAFGINVGVVVDTHVERLSVRLGLAEAGTPIPRIERRLMALFPRDRWCEVSHLLIFHGRYACKARGVECPSHPVCAEFGSACELRVSARPRKAAEVTGKSRARARGRAR
ncbi:MAG: endonuclease III [Phycisphaerales bacterium]|nr:endonuclease III [Phycisphaerales bacterium]